MYLIKLLLVLIFTPQIIFSLTTKTKNNFTFRHNETYWESLTNFAPINNATYGTIKLGRSLKMEFKFIYFSRIMMSNELGYHENAFRIGYSGSTDNTASGAGSRYPSMWIYYIDGLPHCKISISDKGKTWREFRPYEIKTHETYSVSIQFNQKRVYISITNTDTQFIIDEERQNNGTNPQFLDTNMLLWISQFGHGLKETPAANITMFDMRIQTWDHHETIATTNNPTTSVHTEHTNAPTVDPITAIPTYHTIAPTKDSVAPTEAPVVGDVAVSEPIELYAFYDEVLVEYKQNIDVYNVFIYDAIKSALENVTAHSMNVENGDKYHGKTWNFGGLHAFDHCMVFNVKISGMYINCPLIPHPQSNEFEYAVVGLLYAESDGNVTGFREYIMEHLNSITFAETFRGSLSRFVNEDQALLVLHERHDSHISHSTLSVEVIGFIVMLSCLLMSAICGMWKVCNEKIVPMQKKKMEMVKICNDDSEQRSFSIVPIERT